MHHLVVFLLLAGLSLHGTFLTGASAQSLRGSAASLDRQNIQARHHDFTYVRDRKQLQRFVRAGLLVPVPGNRYYRLKAVSFPVARPEVKLFVERLSRQFHRACGQPLIVTSLTRPIRNQPRNASARSVHPTGMAVDLRRPNNRTCRNWLENTLLYLEEQKVLEATRERRPPHYHIAIFPRAYATYVDRVRAGTLAARASGRLTHTVRRNDTLWQLSRRYNTTIRAIQRANDLMSAVIHPGQVLRIPVSKAPRP